MKEIYRTFEGKLDVQNQFGTILYVTGTNKIMAESLSAWSDIKTSRYRFPESEKYNRNSPEKIMEDLGEIEYDIENGRIEGEVFYNNKWVCPQKIMDAHKTYKWRQYV